MAENFYTILTAIGRAKLANSAVLGSKANFKTLKVGDGKGRYYEPSENQTSLVNQVWSGNISSISVDENNPNWIVIETSIPATIGGFFIREAGIFDEEEDLIAISKLSETYKPVVSEGSTKDLCIKIILEVSNVESVTLKIDPTVIVATKKDIQVIESEVKGINAQLSDLANKTNMYATNTSITDDYVIALTGITSYSDIIGKPITFKATVANTNGATINVNNLGAKTIVRGISTTLVTGDIPTNKFVTVIYDGTYFQLQSQGNNLIKTNDFAKLNNYATTDGTSTGSSYTVTNTTPWTDYSDGTPIIIVPNVDCLATPTLNIDGLGALTIVNQDGSAISAGDIKANLPLSLVRVGSNFFIRSGSSGLKDLKTAILQKASLSNGNTSNLTIKQLTTLINLGRTDSYYFKYTSIAMPSSPLTMLNIEYGNKIYMLYNTSAAPKVVRVQYYDTSTSIWTQLSPTLNILYSLNHCITIVGSDIYFMDYANGCIYKYSITLNTFTTIGIYANFVNAGIMAYNGYLYIAGGSSDNNNKLFTKYNVSTYTSTTLAALPIAMDNPKMVYSNGYIYAVDTGSNGTNGSGSIYKYNIATNTWTFVITMSYFGFGYGIINCYGDYIYIQVSYNSVYRYSISTNTYKDMRLYINAGGFWSNQIIIGDYLYVCSGFSTTYIHKFPITEMNPLINYF